MSSSWFRRGVVDATRGNVEIRGTGTHWLNGHNPARPTIGDIFTADNKTFYECMSFPTDSKIVLDRPFEGANVVAGHYAIIRNSSATVNTDLAARVTRIFNQKQKLFDEVATWLTVARPTSPITDAIGQEHEVITPWQLSEMQHNISALSNGILDRGSCDLSKGSFPPPYIDVNSVKHSCLWVVGTGGVVDAITFAAGDNLLYSVQLDGYRRITTGGGVTSVNGESGLVTITHDDVGALGETGTAVNSNLLENLTAAQIITEAKRGQATQVGLDMAVAALEQKIAALRAEFLGASMRIETHRMEYDSKLFQLPASFIGHPIKLVFVQGVQQFEGNAFRFSDDGTQIEFVQQLLTDEQVTLLG